MGDVMISLLAPVSPATIDGWVEEQVDRLRSAGRRSGVLLGRLVRSRPAQGGDWLVQVDRRGRDVRVEEDVALASIVTAMERMGLRPVLFVAARRPATLAYDRRSSYPRRGVAALRAAAIPCDRPATRRRRARRGCAGSSRRSRSA